MSHRNSHSSHKFVSHKNVYSLSYNTSCDPLPRAPPARPGVGHIRGFSSQPRSEIKAGLFTDATSKGGKRRMKQATSRMPQVREGRGGGHGGRGGATGVTSVEPG